MGTATQPSYPALRQSPPSAKPVDSWLPAHLADAADPENWMPLHRPSAPSATGTSAEVSPSRGNGSAKPTESYAKPRRNAPAAGASGGRAPLPATYFGPRFVNLDAPEIDLFFNKLRDPLAFHVYMLIRGHSVFETGEFLGSYAGLMELCTPPQPERGKRRLGPSMKVLRRAIDDIVAHGAMRRGSSNKEQGQLRLFITLLPFKNIGTSMQ